MDSALYIAMGGAKRRLTEQGVYSNNLANVNTTGFREDLYVAESFYVNQPGHLPIQAYSASGINGINTRGGPLTTTDRDLDVAVHGQGWLVVSDGESQQGLTRSGSLQINRSGNLVTSTGMLVMGTGGPVTIPPYDALDIADDGSISIVPQGQPPNALVLIGRLQLVNPPAEALVKTPDGLVRPREEDLRLEDDPNVRIVTRSLEGSNVSAVEQMVNMIDASKAFDVQVKLIENIDSNQQALAQLLQE